MSLDLKQLRNIGIAAHIDAGKTTTTERILFYTGTSYKMGEVDDGTTVTDFEKQEQQRGITIYSAAVTCPWKGHTINLIDTPGHVDFTAEVERSLRVLDGMVAVFDAKEGVEAQSETVWHQADKYNVPRICLINKMDKAGADFEASIKSIETRLEGRAVAIQIPIGAESAFEGIIDLLEMKTIRFQEGDLGRKPQIGDIPSDLRDSAAHWRSKLVERVCETDDTLTERFLDDQELSAEDLKPALRRATIANVLRPVLCGSSLRYMGVQQVLDAVCDYLPSPLDVPPTCGLSAGDDQKEITLKPDPKEPFAGLVFKIVADKPVDLYYIRIYSGRLTPNSRVFNPLTGQKENVTRLLRMYARRRDAVDQAVAGEIVAVVGPKNALTGHTLCSPNRKVILESISFPDTVIARSIEPASSRDREKLDEALRALTKQDPTFRFRQDEETGQTLMSGMGELHLEVLTRRITDDLNVNVRVGQPRVSYRETISEPAQGEGRFVKELGGKRHFAVARLRLEPVGRDAASVCQVFRSEVSSDVISSEFISAVGAGVNDAAMAGPLLGYPVIDWRAVLVDAQQHATDSSEMAFENAAQMAFNLAAQAGKPVLMEPIMLVEIRTPDAYFGAVNTDLNARRAVITDTDVRGRHRVIQAEAPLAEMFGYTTHLRSLTQGRATASMEPLRYAPIPASVAAKMLQ